jgi:hypothetical protein
VHFKQGSIDDADLEKWERIMGAWHHGLVFIKEVPAFTDVTLVEQAVRELEAKGIKIHAITIDHLPHVKPIQQAWGENDERFKAASDCKELARWLRLPVVVPTQAATIVEEKQSKGKPGGKLDVYGSKGQVHVANTFVLVTETGKDDTQTALEDWERDVFWRCDCKKNRDGATFWFRAKHFVKIGKIVEVPKDGESGSAATAAAGAAALKEAKEAEKGSKQGKEGAKGSTPVSEAVPPPIAVPVADSAKLAQEVLKEEEARVASKSEAIPVESIVEAKQETVTVEKEPEPEHHLSTLDRLRKKGWRITPESKGGGV